MALIFFDSWIQYRARLGFLPDIDLVDRTKYKLLLTTSPSYSGSDSLATVIASELEGVNSTAYQRLPVEWGSGDSGTFDSLNRSQSLAPRTLTVSGQLTFLSAVLLADCPDTAAGVAISSVSPSTDTITTATEHARLSGDQVMLYSDEAIPAGVDNETIYYADPTSTTALRLMQTITGGIIDLTSAGLGNQYLRFANGIPVGFAIADSSTFVPAGQTLPITLTIGVNQDD